MRSIASRRKKCAGATAVIAAGAAAIWGWRRRHWGWRRRTGVGVAGIGAGIAAAVVGTAATGAAVITGRRRQCVRAGTPHSFAPRDLFESAQFPDHAQKKPRASGALSSLLWSKRSDDAAASIAPHGAIGAHAAGPHHDDRGRTHDDRRRRNHDGPAIGLAAAIGTAMPAGAASARGIRRAEAGNRAERPKLLRKGTSCFLPLSAALRHDREPSHEDLNGT